MTRLSIIATVLVVIISACLSAADPSCSTLAADGLTNVREELSGVEGRSFAFFTAKSGETAVSVECERYPRRNGQASAAMKMISTDLSRSTRSPLKSCCTIPHVQGDKDAAMGVVADEGAYFCGIKMPFTRLTASSPKNFDTFAKNLLAVVDTIHKEGYVVNNICPKYIAITATDEVRMPWMGHSLRIDEDGSVKLKQGVDWAFASEVDYTHPKVVAMWSAPKYREVHDVSPGELDTFSIAAVFFELLVGKPLFGQGGLFDAASKLRNSQFLSGEWVAQAVYNNRRVFNEDAKWKSALTEKGAERYVNLLSDMFVGDKGPGAFLSFFEAEDAIPDEPRVVRFHGMKKDIVPGPDAVAPDTPADKVGPEDDTEDPAAAVPEEPVPDPTPHRPGDRKKLVKFLWTDVEGRVRRMNKDADLYLQLHQIFSADEMVAHVNKARNFRARVGRLLMDNRLVPKDAILSSLCNDGVKPCQFTVAFFPEVRLLEYFESLAENEEEHACALTLYKSWYQTRDSPSFRFDNLRGGRECSSSMKKKFNYDRLSAGGSSGTPCSYDFECPNGASGIEFCHLTTPDARKGLVGTCKKGPWSSHLVDVKVVCAYASSNKVSNLKLWPYTVPSGTEMENIERLILRDPDFPITTAPNMKLRNKYTASKGPVSKGDYLSLISEYMDDLVEEAWKLNLSRCANNVLLYSTYGRRAMAAADQCIGERAISTKIAQSKSHEGARCTVNKDCEHYPFQTCQMKTLWTGQCTSIASGTWQNRDLESRPRLRDAVELEFEGGTPMGRDMARKFVEDKTVDAAPFPSFSVVDAARTGEHSYSYIGAPFDCQAFSIQDQERCGTCWAFSAATSLSQTLCTMTGGRANLFASPAGFFLRSKDYYISEQDSPIPERLRNLNGGKGVNGAVLKHPNVPLIGGHGGHITRAFGNIAFGGKATKVGVLPWFCRPLNCQKLSRGWQALKTKFKGHMLGEAIKIWKEYKEKGEDPTTNALVRRYGGTEDSPPKLDMRLAAEMAMDKIAADKKAKQYAVFAGLTKDLRLLEICKTRKVKRVNTDAERPYTEIGQGMDWLANWHQSAEQIYSHLIHNGPVSVGLDIKHRIWCRQIGSVFVPNVALDRVNHAVVIVGWGIDTVDGKDVPFWLIQNSYGLSWGEGGYYKAYRGFDKECWARQADSKQDLNCAADYLMYGNSVFSNIADDTMDAYKAITANCGQCANSGYMLSDCSTCICRGQWKGQKCDVCDIQCPANQEQSEDCECKCKDPYFFGADCDQYIEIGLTTPTEQFPKPAPRIQSWKLDQVSKSLRSESYRLTFQFTNVATGERKTCTQVLHGLSSRSPKPFVMPDCISKIPLDVFSTWTITATVPARTSELGEILEASVPVRRVIKSDR